jgi:hypothetical protein
MQPCNFRYSHCAAQTAADLKPRDKENEITEFERRSEKNLLQLCGKYICCQAAWGAKGKLRAMRQMLFLGVPLSVSQSGKPLHDLPQGKATALQNLSP